MEKKFNIEVFIRNWIVAGSTAAVARTITAPIDRVKVIMQTQNMSRQYEQFGLEPYKNVWDCFKRLASEHGILTYWRGNTASLLRYIPSVAFSFAFNDLFKGYLLKKDSSGNMREHFWSNAARQMLCGALAGLATHTFIHPLAMCHTQIAGDISHSAHKLGMRHCMVHTFVKSKLSGLYAGYVAAATGVSLYRSTYFGLFEIGKFEVEQVYGKRVPFAASLALAQIVTIFAGFVAYPFDTISRNQQMATAHSRTGHHEPFFETIHTLVEDKGYSVLFRGAMINAVRSACCAMIIVVYDEIQYVFFTPKQKKKTALVTLRYHQFWRTRYPERE